jgi:mannose-6-phosphate isomerase-like protein (cupin superfamily)
MGKVAKIKPQNTESTTQEERPWGSFEVLKSEEHFKAKVMRVMPGQQISYQSHTKREEHWVIIKGSGLVILNNQNIIVKKGQYIHVPLGSKHRIRNTGHEVLEFVEVQLGTYFGEDDIVSYEDDYQRK